MPQLAKRDLEMICDSTESHWHSFRNQQLFITGGTGFFGRWMLESFLAANHRFALKTRATVLTRDPARFRNSCPHLADHPAITLLRGDVRSFAFPQGEFGSPDDNITYDQYRRKILGPDDGWGGMIPMPGGYY